MRIQLDRLLNPERLLWIALTVASQVIFSGISRGWNMQRIHHCLSAKPSTNEFLLLEIRRRASPRIVHFISIFLFIPTDLENERDTVGKVSLSAFQIILQIDKLRKVSYGPKPLILVSQLTVSSVVHFIQWLRCRVCFMLELDLHSRSAMY
ncbi:hypothetical protein DY000_02055142 [Brassica cretica]|uniref:Uncharacterized protein n=1 Tax=Brassica cretica TaxID=69181 RepID=A0ABQ7AIA7_BRACR|nr:hypothetical protein DY000_02055142 [Brassica cretica]